MDIIRGEAPSRPGPADWFTGVVRMEEIASGEPPSRLRALRVHFAAGARTAWHSHPAGQLLHVTEGTGRVQSRGGAVEEIAAGDIVRTPPGEWHWHGAAPQAAMTHLALQEADADGSTTSWDRHVSDDEYR
jgi:quercetin dioxygenase-like cupin family protein